MNKLLVLPKQNQNIRVLVLVNITQLFLHFYVLGCELVSEPKIRKRGVSGILWQMQVEPS